MRVVVPSCCVSEREDFLRVDLPHFRGRAGPDTDDCPSGLAGDNWITISTKTSFIFSPYVAELFNVFCSL